MILKQTQIRVDFGLFDDPDSDYVTVVYEGDGNKGFCRIGKTLVYKGEDAGRKFDYLHREPGVVTRKCLALIGFS